MDNFNNLNHFSVMLNESIKGLNLQDNKIYVDATLGGAGHSSEILKYIPNGFLYCFDQDEMAIEKADKRLKDLGYANYEIIKSNFANLKEELAKRNVFHIDGIIYDLGVSSFQFDLPSRGFSYRFDAKLDMRMDLNNDLDAYYIVNNYDIKDLTNIFNKYGEEKYSYFIARKICEIRKTKSIETTFELVDAIKKALPSKALRSSSHPAKQVFQALRIEVNKELQVLEKSLLDALDLLNVNGRISVITFHSLEDRIVKNIFRSKTTLDLPKGLPFIPEGYKINYQLVNNHVIIPSAEELSINNRSHSAKLRIIERISL